MSGRPKYATKPDLNQKEIVDELRSLGFDVDVICDLPGLYDIVVSGERHIKCGHRIIAALECSLRVEIKSKDGLISDAEFEYAQAQLHRNSYVVAYCTKDILRWFNGNIAPQ